MNREVPFMWSGRSKGCGWLCISPSVLKCVAMGMIAAGVLLVVLFVPAKYWMALLGMLLIAAGAAIRCFLQ